MAMYEQLIKELRDWVPEFYDHCTTCPEAAYGLLQADLMTKAANAIEELTAWIPVTELLPKPYKEVLFCGKSIYGGVQISYGYWEPYPNNSIKWIDMIDNEIPIDPTHWMPLPDPPEEE